VPTASLSLPGYDRSQSYGWNYDHAPDLPREIDVPPVPGDWTFCGRLVHSPLGIAAGPQLNGRWIHYYAALGFDVLTYKTVRSRQRDCYPLPNLAPIESDALFEAGREVRTHSDMLGSWAVSFGMPSMPPDVWRSDVEWTKKRLAKEKLLSVSVVATPETNWSLDELAEDFAQCAQWAVESGADCIETNFSCPNVATCDGQLYQQPAAAALVAQCVREAIGKTPYLIKIGFVNSQALAEELLDAVAPHVDALTMTNCISATVRGSNGGLLFDGQPRGIGGDAIRAASINQVKMFADLVKQRGDSTRIIGCGGISQAQHVHAYLDAGAKAVQLATAVMTNPRVGLEIREDLAASLA
jgi:dihydroorotate dehydrogenase (NAD+) catalytic subunit